MRRRFDPDCLISGGRKILQEILCSVTNNVGVRLCGPRPARTGVAWSVTGRGLLSPLFPARSLWSLVTRARTTRAHNLSPRCWPGWPALMVGLGLGTGRPRLASLAGLAPLTGSDSGLWLRGPVWAGAGSPSVLLLTPHPVSVMTPGQHYHRQPQPKPYYIASRNCDIPWPVTSQSTTL